MNLKGAFYPNPFLRRMEATLGDYGELPKICATMLITIAAMIGCYTLCRGWVSSAGV
jgi:hypothetical protein